MARKKFTFDSDRFESIRSRVADLYINEGEAIRAKATVWSHPVIFTEMKWLIDEINRIGGGVLDDKAKFRFDKITRTVMSTFELYGDKVKFGEIMKVSATIFSAMRFLVQQLEVIVAMEDAEAISPLRLPPPDTARIELNLEEGIGDTGQEEEEAFAAIGAAVGADAGEEVEV